LISWSVFSCVLVPAVAGLTGVFWPFWSTYAYGLVMANMEGKMPKPKLSWQQAVQLLQQEAAFTPASFDQLTRNAKLFADLGQMLANRHLSAHDLAGLLASCGGNRTQFDLNALPLAFRNFARTFLKLVDSSVMNDQTFDGIPQLSRKSPLLQLSGDQERGLSTFLATDPGEWFPSITIAGFHWNWFSPFSGIAGDGQSRSVVMRGSNLSSLYGEKSEMQTGLRLYYTGSLAPYAHNRRPSLESLQQQMRTSFRSKSLVVRFASVQECVYFSVMHLFLTGKMLTPASLVVPDKEIGTGTLVHWAGFPLSGSEELLHTPIVVEWSQLYPGYRGSDSYLLPIVEFN